MPLMKCGCSAQGRDGNGNPVCAVHFGIHPGATEVADTPDLSGRMAKCTYCANERPSDISLAFFTHTPNKPKDNYYCGCYGWN